MPKKEKIKETWVKIQWWVGERLLWKLGLINNILWICKHPWTVYYFKTNDCQKPN